jgi:hypothetical protein
LSLRAEKRRLREQTLCLLGVCVYRVVHIIIEDDSPIV